MKNESVSDIIFYTNGSKVVLFNKLMKRSMIMPVYEKVYLDLGLGLVSWVLSICYVINRKYSYFSPLVFTEEE